MRKHSLKVALPACGTAIAIALALTPIEAQADQLVPIAGDGTLALSQSWASTSTGQTPVTVTGTGTNTGSGVVVNDLTGNGSSTYGFSQSFNSPTGSYLAATSPLANGDEFGFVSSYVIDIPTATAGAYVFSLNLNASTGLDNLTARLYEYNVNGNQNLTLGITGTPASGWSDAWSTSTNGYVASTTLSAANMSSGWYVLEVAGLEVGSQSGMYSGQLSVSPVPVPRTLMLLLSGLALLWLGARLLPPLRSQPAYC